MTGIRQQFVQDARAFARAAANLPVSWRKKVISNEVMQSLQAFPMASYLDDRIVNNHDFVGMVRETRGFPLPVAMSDADIIEYATARAHECERLTVGVADGKRAIEWCEGVAQKCGVDPIQSRVNMETGVVSISYASMLKRYTCEMWWRRRIRRSVAVRLEGAAINFGMVHRRTYGGAYVSSESYRRWQQQQSRNRRMMEKVIMRNEETGDERALVEFVDASIANPNLRRGELMTRIRGFEEIAQREGHLPLFITATAPSRMHARMSASGELNPKYDGTKPDDAQKYFCKLWARSRARLAREGVKFYGFRVVEPHHDGCPHWHMLFFVAPMDGEGDAVRACDLLKRAIRFYWLQDSPGEVGAEKHRVTQKVLDGSAGAASSYIAKYIAKGVGTLDEGDLFDAGKGEEQKPRAWASTWRVRQFQQIGGPPVGLWRELRRVPSDAVPVDAPEQLAFAWYSVQRDGDKLACWRSFVDACGGWMVTRTTSALQLVRKSVEGLTRYGEQRPDALAGVACGVFIAESVRAMWVVVSSTWSRVNNCTVQAVKDCVCWSCLEQLEVGGLYCRTFNERLRQNKLPADGVGWAN